MNKLKLSYEGQINHLKSKGILFNKVSETCLLYTSPSPRD